jgi:hypothetical protein
MAGLDLSKQIGPLPLGMWLLVGTGGLGLAYVINTRMAKSAKAASEPSTQQLTESGVGTGAGQLIYTPPSTVPTENTATNDAWGRNVSNWLVSKGITATAADQAVRKYLAGNALTTAELAMLNLAIVQFGVPPQSLPPAEEQPPDDPTPTETPKVPPTAPKNVRVNPATRRNDIVWEHDGLNVTHFFVQAKARATGETITANVGAYPLQTRYVWSHFLPGSAPGNMTYDYLVVAWNGTTMGGQGTTASNFKM